LENQLKKFHFQELGWLICFPSCENKGKYVNYSVILKKGPSHPEKSVKLGEVVEDLEFERNFPHTVGYFKVSSGEGADFKPDYLELRKIGCVEEFWSFLNALDI
jgi:hypothetical protein